MATRTKKPAPDGETSGASSKTTRDKPHIGNKNQKQEAVAVARGYLMRTPPWHPVPVGYRSKEPIHTAWQTLNINLDNVGQYFNSGPMNVGVQLGPKSNGLTDADLDC